MRAAWAGLLLVVLLGGAVAPAGQSSFAFRDVAAGRGLDYVGQPSRAMTAGGGAYVADYDRDGWPDVLLTGGVPRSERSDRIQRPALYHNAGGEFDLSNALPASVADLGTVGGALFFDYDRDGWPDLLLLPVGGAPVLLENRNGSFHRVDAGFEEPLSVPLGASAADYDRDGDLDLFVYQNGDWGERSPRGRRRPNATVETDNGEPNVLYERTDDGFERVADAGIEGARWSLAASFVDLTGDGWPDVYVANDYGEDRLYVNRRDGTFRAVDLGPATDRNGMSSEVADVNGDGRLDVFVTNVHFDRSALESASMRAYVDDTFGDRARGNDLLVNRGNGSFVDRADRFGVRAGGWGWAAAFADFDDDGDRDLIHATKSFAPGLLRGAFGTSEYPARYRYPAVWERRGDRFVRRDGGDLGLEPADGRGLATLDFDRDGDLDVLVAEWGDGGFHLYRTAAGSGHWLEVDVRGDADHLAVGARVAVTAGGETWTRVRNARADYLSQDTRLVHVGLGDAARVDRLRVVYPDGTVVTATDLPADRRVVVTPDGVETA
ncbi:MAG: CRTAC1 family protein [Halobacteriaceae archaeon]